MKLMKILLLTFALCSIFPACSAKKPSPTILLPPISALDFGTDWGVVTSNYLRMRERPNKDAGLLHGLTRGSIVEILSKTGETETIENETAAWYSINLDGFRGWVFGAYLKIFNSKATADTFARELK